MYKNFTYAEYLLSLGQCVLGATDSTCRNHTFLPRIPYRYSDEQLQANDKAALQEM